jgi:polysaccharide biosynthesis/export protein
MRLLFYLLAFSFLVSSCVTNKKFVYLQKDDVNPAKDQLPKDTLVREYESQQYQYKIQPNDLVSVRFESLSTEEFDFLRSSGNQSSAGTNLNQNNALLIGELVDDFGNIAFPYVGKVKVSGLTIFQIQDTLQYIANKYLESPVVKARLLNYRMTILGEANKEGTITFPNNRVSMLEAIGLAGGLTDLANKENLKLIRQVDGKTKVAYINILDENFINSPYYYVHQNDILIVGALKQRPFRKYFGQNFALVVSSVTLLFLAISITK